MKLPSVFVVETPEQTSERKRLFAQELLRNPSKPFEVALKIFGSDTGGALRAANEWPADLEVISFQNELLEEVGEFAFLPSEAEIARELLDTARLWKERDPLAAKNFYDLFLDVRGFKKKQGQQVNVNVQQNNVMMVPTAATNEEWEAGLRAQQRKLRSEVIASDAGT